MFIKYAKMLTGHLQETPASSDPGNAVTVITQWAGRALHAY